jgi:REP element-mobilizing transposase RayT
MSTELNSPGQVPRSVYAEIPEESAVWEDQTAAGVGVSRSARRKECRIEEGHLMPDHVHMLILIPSKYSVAEIIGYMKGKSSIWVAQDAQFSGP